MATIIDTEIQNPKYINYLKIGLGLQELHKGISPSIDTVLRSVHASLISRVKGSSCGVCTTANLLLHPNCSAKFCICKKNPSVRRPCQTSTCDVMYNEIVKLHQKNQPQFQHTTLWQTYVNHWEFGKCFLPPAGYGAIKSASECDTTGLLSIVINCTEVANMLGVATHSTTKTDLFHQVKDIRNSLMHAVSLEMEDVEMKTSLDKMIQILQCGSMLPADDDAKYAAERLDKLKDRSFVVTKAMEKDVIEKELKAMQSDREEMKTNVNKVRTGVENVTADVKNIKTGVEDVNTNVVAVKTGVEKVTADVEEVKTGVEKVTTDVVAVKTGVENVTADVVAVKTGVENVTADVVAVKNGVENVTADVVAVKTGVEKVTADVVGVMTGVEKVTADVEEIKTGVEKVTTDVVDVKTGVEEMNTNVVEVKTDVENVAADLVDVKTGVEKVTADVEDVKTRVGEIHAKLSYLAKKENKKKREDRHRGSEYFRQQQPIGHMGGNENIMGTEDERQTRPNPHLEKLTRETGTKMKRHLKKENAGFESRLTTDLSAKLHENRILVLTGQSGIGKTHQALNILKTVQERKEYVPVIVNDISDVIKIVPHHEPVCIMIDDIIGKFSTNKESLLTWGKRSDTWFSLADDGKLMVIVTINSVNWNDCSHNSVHNEFKPYCVDLDKDGMKPEEKSNLVFSFGINPDSETTNTLLSDGKLPLGLPLLCTLAKNKTTDISDLMKESLKANIMQMTSPHCIALLMVLFTGETFSDAILNTDAERHISVCFNKLLDAYKDENLNATKVVFAASSLVGSYLDVSDEGVYHFKHGSVLEAVFKAAIDLHLRHILIRYCHLPTLLNLSQHLRHHMTEEMITILFERFERQSVLMKEVGTSPLWLDKHFQEKPLHHFKTNLDIFINTDENGESLMVTFAGLGLTGLLKSLLHRYSQFHDNNKLQKQVELAILRACSHGQKECVAMLLAKSDNCVKNEHLFHCIQSGSKELFDYLLEMGGNIEARQESDGRNLIHVACAHNQISLVEMIVSKMDEDMCKTLLNMTTLDTKETPLCIAVQKCNVGTVHLLKKYGCDPNVKDEQGRNLLHLALRNGGQDEMVDYLSEAYPEMINQLSIDKETCLYFAAGRGDLKYILKFIETGLQPMSCTSSGLTMLHVAALNGKNAVVLYFCEMFTDMVKQNDQLGSNAAHAAAKGGHLKCLELLIDKGIDPLARTSDQLTLLHYAALGGSQKTVEYLCQIFPDMIKQTDKNGLNAAHFAGRNGHLGCLELLLDKGIDPLSRTLGQSSLLHCAASGGSQKTVQYLCQNFPDMIKQTDDDGRNAAHRAASNGHLECLELLLDNDIDLLSRTSDQSTLLHYAASGGTQRIVECLCQNFPDMIKQTDDDGRNAAHHAASNGHLECLELLLDKGIDPLSRTSDQSTLLHYAASGGTQRIVEYLCQNFPDMIKQTDDDGRNAAYDAASNGHLECLELLLDKGMNPLLRTSDQSTLLHDAASGGSQKAVEYLCQNFPDMIKQTDDDGRNVAHRAASNGHLECLELLLHNGIDPLSRTSDQVTFLHDAASGGTQRIVEYLCQNFPDMIKQTDDDGRNAAHHAASNGHLECLELLLDKGIDPLSRTSDQSTLLHYAASGGTQRIVEYLCQNFPDMIKQTDDDGRNAAHDAASNGHLECLQLLLDKGMDPLSRTSDQSTLLHCAASGGSQKAVEYLCQNFPDMIKQTDDDGRNVAHRAASNGHLECLELLLHKGIDPLSRTSDQVTFLHDAASGGTQRIVEYLCQNFPDMIKQTDDDGRNAAHHAASNGHLECLELLLHKGIDPLSRTSYQSTLLHYAASGGTQRIVEYLCQNFPDMIKQTDDDGRNAAHHAASNGHLECLELLLHKGIDPLSRTSYLSTLLHYAASGGSQRIVGYLCQSYPDMIKQTSDNGYNAAHFAARNGHLECLELLLDKDIDPLSRTSKRSTLLHLAALGGSQKTVEYLCKNFPDMIKQTDDDGRNAAHHAAEKAHLECLELLLDKGIDPLSRTSDQSTLLHYGASGGSQRIVGYLCQSYPDLIKQIDKNGVNAAHWAAEYGHLECLELLLDKGIDPLSRTSGQSTLLHFAALGGSQKTVQYLCQNFPGMIKQTDKNGVNAAHCAAQKAHLECLEVLLDKGIDPLSRTSGQLTLLHYAALGGSQKTVEYLCQNFPDMIKQTDKNGVNAAHCAARNGHLECLELLLDKGIDPFSGTSGQLTLLYYAALADSQKTVEYLCQNFPDMIKQTDKNGVNAALCAARNGHLECLELLLDKGIDPLSRTSGQLTLLHNAALAGSQKTVEYIGQNFPDMIKQTDKNGVNAAHLAASKGHLECLEILLDKGIDPLSITSNQSTLLHYAADGCSQKTVEYICQNFPDMIKQTEKKGVNAAHVAAKNGHLECLELLLDKGIDPLSRTSDQSTLLHNAALGGSQKTVEYLCQNFPDMIKQTDKNGVNAAHCAAENGHLECLELLLGKGIDPLSRSSDQSTLLHYAASGGSQKTVEYLCQNFPDMIKQTNKDGVNAAHCAAENGHLECLELLLDKGIDPLSRTSGQLTLLHNAALGGSQKTVEYLCQNFPDMIKQTDKNGVNAALCAARNGHLECLEILLDKGIDPLSITSNQSTLLHYAADGCSQKTVEYICQNFPDMIKQTEKKGVNAAHVAARNGHLECLELLLDKGIDPLSRTSDQSTLLHYAASGGSQKTVEYLCQNFPDIIKHTNKNGLNAAHYAARNGHRDCLQLLQDKENNSRSRDRHVQSIQPLIHDMSKTSATADDDDEDDDDENTCNTFCCIRL